MTFDPSDSTIDALLAQVLAHGTSQPERPAIIEAQATLFAASPASVTYGQLSARIRAVVAEVRKQGLRVGDPVLFAVAPGTAAIVLLAGLLLAGAEVVGVDAGVDPRLFAERMRLVRPRWAIAESVLLAAGRRGVLRWWLRRRGLTFPDLSLSGARLFRVGRRWPGTPAATPATSLMVASPRSAVTLASLPAARPAYLAFTSGTTAAPKGVVHTARSLGAGCSIVAKLLALQGADVLYTTQAHITLAGLLRGAVCVTPGARFDPQRFLADVERYGVTHTYAMPFEMAAVLRILERRGRNLPASLRSIVLGGAPIPRAFLARLRAACSAHTDVWCVYAMTEMFPVALIESRDKLAYRGEGDLLGTPVAGALVDIAADGEFLVRGPNLFDRYLGGEPVTWHATGDRGQRDSAGRIVLHGRKKDMIIRGQHNIYPSLYEEHILAIPGVADCALVGVRDEQRADERLVLAVEPRGREDAAQLRARVARALHDGTCPIDTFALPDSIVVCSVPRSGRASKPDRRRLAAMLAGTNTRGG